MTGDPRVSGPSPGGPDWDAVRDETIAILQRLIRIVTVNPPGSEIGVAREIADILAADGIEAQVLEPSPGRAALVARLRGTGERGAVLLMAHMDVVGVEAERWSVDPFGGEVRDGYLYGRGAIDDKGMLAANLETVLLLKRHVVDAGGSLARDVVLLATSDEETGGPWGLGWIIENHRELIRADFALNEGGRARIIEGGRAYLAIQTSEKVPHVVRMTAKGPNGHAAIPLAGNAVLRLGRALASLGGHAEPVRLTPATERFFSDLSAIWPDAEEREAMADIASRSPDRVRRGAERIARIPTLDALLRNGISATILEGGSRPNVIPSEVSATLNVRTLPDESVDDVIERLQRAVRDPDVRFEVVERGEDAPSSDPDSPMFTALESCARALREDLVVVPYLSTGATDSAKLRRAGTPCYGILPFPMSLDDEGRMHGHDERIPVESLLFGTRLIHDAVRTVAVAT